MTDFRQGEKVICVDNSPGYRSMKPCSLVLGKTYVILEILQFLPVIRRGIPVRVDSSGLFWSSCRFRRPRVDESNSTVSSEKEIAR